MTNTCATCRSLRPGPDDAPRGLCQVALKLFTDQGWFRPVDPWVEAQAPACTAYRPREDAA